jgi:hypothetical protein
MYSAVNIIFHISIRIIRISEGLLYVELHFFIPSQATCPHLVYCLATEEHAERYGMTSLWHFRDWRLSNEANFVSGWLPQLLRRPGAHWPCRDRHRGRKMHVAVCCSFAESFRAAATVPAGAASCRRILPLFMLREVDRTTLFRHLT